MADVRLLQGELQTQVMAALWRMGEGTVEQVRAALPSRYRGAYTTVQTVLNRLAERAMLARRKEGSSYVYVPRFSEAEYLSRAIERTLASASREARQAALVQLVGGLEREKLTEMQDLARDVDRRRGTPS